MKKTSKASSSSYISRIEGRKRARGCGDVVHAPLTKKSSATPPKVAGCPGKMGPNPLEAFNEIAQARA